MKEPMRRPRLRHEIMSAVSTDGIDWIPENKVVIPWGSVPEAIYGPDGWIWLFFTSRGGICLAKSVNGLDFSDDILIIKPRSDNECFVDPNPVVLVDGSIRCYVTHCYDIKRNVHGSPQERFATFVFTAFTSSDGRVWTLDSRIKYEDPHGRPLMDPFVIWMEGNRFRLYSPIGNRTTDIVDSTDGGKTFPIIRKTFSGGDVAQVMRVKGGWRMYYVGGEGPGKSQYTGIAESVDGLNWKILKDRAFEGGWGAYVLEMPDGRYRMYYIHPKA